MYYYRHFTNDKTEFREEVMSEVTGRKRVCESETLCRKQFYFCFSNQVGPIPEGWKDIETMAVVSGT